MLVLTANEVGKNQAEGYLVKFLISYVSIMATKFSTCTWKKLILARKLLILIRKIYINKTTADITKKSAYVR